MVLFRFVYCTHFPAIYFKVGAPSGSVDVIPMWVTYTIAEANKTWGLLRSTLLQIPDERVTRVSTQSCSSMALSSRGKFLLPWSRNQPPPTMPLTQRQAPYARDALAASPANEDQGTLPIRLVSALGEQHWHLPLRASKRCLWGGPQHVPVQVP